MRWAFQKKILGSTTSGAKALVKFRSRLHSPRFFIIYGNNCLALKKTIAIFFLVIFLFNVGGYHVVFWALRSQAKNNLLHRLDADAYSSEDVVVLTLPVSLPYPLHDNDYERATGEVEFKGEYYQLVKQKVENDTLFMVCVKDGNQKHLQQTMNDYTNLANNLPTSAKHTMDLLSKLFKDFTSTDFTIPSPDLFLKAENIFAVPDFAIIQQSFPVDSPPPDFI